MTPYDITPAAEIELQHTCERQAAGIAAAKKKGVYKERAKGTTKARPRRARELKGQGLRAPEIAQIMGISERTVRRYELEKLPGGMTRTISCACEVTSSNVPSSHPWRSFPGGPSPDKRPEIIRQALRRIPTLSILRTANAQAPSRPGFAPVGWGRMEGLGRPSSCSSLCVGALGRRPRQT